MQTSTPKSKVKITIYYWPDVNMGLGHIACLAKEIGGERELYISPGYVMLNDSTKPHVGIKSDIRIWNSNSFIECLNEQITDYNSPNVIKIELPESDFSYDIFLRNFATFAKNNINNYDFLKKNCSHLVNRALLTAYPGRIPYEQTLGLRPFGVAKDACALLDQESGALESKSSSYLEAMVKNPNKDYSSTTSHISRISKYQFARAMIPVTLRHLYTTAQNILEENEKKSQNTGFSMMIKDDSPWQADLDSFLSTKLDFTNAINKTPLNDTELTAKFTALKTNIIKLEATIIKIKDNDYKESKYFFAGFGRVLAGDPQLTQLKKIREQLESFFQDCKQEYLAMPINIASQQHIQI